MAKLSESTRSSIIENAASRKFPSSRESRIEEAMRNAYLKYAAEFLEVPLDRIFNQLELPLNVMFGTVSIEVNRKVKYFSSNVTLRDVPLIPFVGREEGGWRPEISISDRTRVPGLEPLAKELEEISAAKKAFKDKAELILSYLDTEKKLKDGCPYLYEVYLSLYPQNIKTTAILPLEDIEAVRNTIKGAEA